MLNSRSQTKIRKMEMLNILSEQRYLNSKMKLNENVESIPETVKECINNNVEITDLTKIPACISLFSEVVTNQKLPPMPDPEQRYKNCGQQLVAAGAKDKALVIATCIFTKVTQGV